MVRSSNEDSGFAGRTLLAVADGMGGHAAGELASSAAIATLAELDDEALETGDVLTALDDSVVSAAERIAEFVAMDQSRAGMGTTVTAIAWRDGRIAVIHVGDSRAYLLRSGELTQITRDHTYVQSLVDAGRISEEEARTHPRRSLLLRAIDGNQVPERDLSIREARAGDRYLLCSDGLSGVLEDPQIAQILASSPDPTATVANLVDAALDGGAPDNVTVVVADVVEVPEGEVLPPASKPVVVGAAGEQRNRVQLPGLHFPDDVGFDPEATDPRGIPAQAKADGSAGSPADHGSDKTAPSGNSAAESAGTAAGALDAAGEQPAMDQVGEEDAADEADTPARPSALRRHWALVVTAIVVLVAAVAGILGLAWWLSAQWYVGVNEGYVAISQGVPQSLLGIPLHRVDETTALPVASLPYYDQQLVTKTIDARSRTEADRIVSSLAAQAAECPTEPVPIGCPPTAATTTAGPGGVQ
jgi:serine/threonine protein phosphatase PrpC